MGAPVTTDSIWQELGRHLFAVVAFTNAHGEPRSAGIVYVVDDGALWVGTETDSWKARHLRHRPAVAVTVPIAKRVRFLPMIKIPDATITFHGTARVLELDDVPPTVVHALFRGREDDDDLRSRTCIVRIDPSGEFVTYGIGVSLMTMRDQVAARGRAPVA
ncbi:MAG: pyridoxamine 5'-phosphate oxidase family protein [Acidimicrobiales bacterium]